MNTDNDSIQCKSEGDYLLVYQLESEGKQIDRENWFRQAWLETWQSHRRELFFGWFAIVFLILLKAGYHRFVYAEEWVLAVLVALIWSGAVVLRHRRKFRLRFQGFLVRLVAGVAYIVLLAASFDATLSNMMAVRWLSASGAKVQFFSDPPRFELGRMIFVFTGPVFYLEVTNTPPNVPVRVFRDLSSMDLSIVVRLGNDSHSHSVTLRNIPQAYFRSNPRVSVTADSLAKIKPDEFQAMIASSLGLDNYVLQGPLTQPIADYLNSSSSGHILKLWGENLSAQDFKKIETIASVKGKIDNLTLTDCEINDESARVLASLAESVELRKGLRIMPTKFKISREAVDAIIANKVPIRNLPVSELTSEQCQGLAELPLLLYLELDHLDAANVDGLRSKDRMMVKVRHLSGDTVEAMIRNEVGWEIRADETSAESQALLRLIQLPALKSFSLLNKSQFDSSVQLLLRK
jgi:hypothetical protein